MIRGGGLLVACAVLLIGGAARADDGAAAKARARFDSGVAAYAAKDYERAVEDFREAQALDPRQETLFAWAQAERLSGDCPSAIVLYRQFLEGEVTPKQAEAARQALERCERSLASRPLAEQAPAPEPSTEVRPPEPPAVAAPPEAVVARRPARAPRTFWKDPLGDALVGGGLAVAAAGAVLLATAGSPDGAATYDDFADRRDRALLKKRLGVAGIGLGGALIAAGVTRWVLWARDGEAGLMVAGRF